MIETVVRHVRGRRAIGGGAWYFKFCGDRRMKHKIGFFVAAAHTNCLKCQKKLNKVFPGLYGKSPAENVKGEK